ncbi:MAG: acetoacetate decarboxylase family protein [Venatoribacter sp.]
MSAWNNDPFFQYPRNPVETSVGPVEMPILYYDNSQWMFLFWGDLAAARELIDDGLEVVSFNGKALIGVAYYEYRDTSIADYNEVGVAIGCVPKGVKVPLKSFASLLCHPDNNAVGMHIIDLPVTTKEACAAGREIWNYPKFVTDITFKENGREFVGIVKDPEGGNDIVTIQGKASLAVPYKVIDLVLYSKHNNQLLRTNVNTRGLGKASLGGTLRLAIGNTNHPMGERLAKLGLNGKKPLLVIRTDKLQLRLNSGAAIA